ncbi:hypothetical protein [uncultured Roseibium sp.]|uniref:hypothetical protein n=1 Tax=uncultured Roseibium sp. TaxID=1936171 RepID=UPI00262A3BFD|nr:hypothetical protein [uncultured Roseibium sp.]
MEITDEHEECARKFRKFVRQMNEHNPRYFLDEFASNIVNESPKNFEVISKRGKQNNYEVQTLAGINVPPSSRPSRDKNAPCKNDEGNRKRQRN